MPRDAFGAGPNPSDVELIAAALGGNQRASTMLDDRHRRRLYGFVRTRVRSDIDAEDITQAAMIYALSNLQRFRPNLASFPTWLRVIALSKITSFYRAQGKNPIADWAQVELLDEKYVPLVTANPDLFDITEASGSRVNLDDADERAGHLQSKAVTCACNSHSAPNQLLIYIYIRELDWKQKRVLNEKIGKLLREIVDDLANRDWRARWRQRDGDLDVYMDGLRAALELTWQSALTDPESGEVYPHLRMFAEMHQHLLQRKVGETALYECFSLEDRAKEMVRWWEVVFRRVSACMGPDAWFLK